MQYIFPTFEHRVLTSMPLVALAYLYYMINLDNRFHKHLQEQNVI